MVKRVKAWCIQESSIVVKHIKRITIIFFMTTELKNQIEALLFASGRKMTAEELKLHLNINSNKEIKQAAEQLQKEHEERQSPIMVVQEGDSWKLTTREKYLQIVRKINPNTELTKTMMETLAVIAWKQPITQSEVIAIRTNKAYEHIGELEKMGFLIKEKYGRTYMLKLTQKFFDYFDLRDAQAAREMFAHVKESEETQRKLEEARAQADAGAAETNLPEVVQQPEEKQTQETKTEQGSQNQTVAKEDLIPEQQESAQETQEEQHQEAVELGEEDAEIENPQDRQEMIDEDEINSQEASFVQGYEKDAAKTLDHSIIQPVQEKTKKKKRAEQ